jgi:hypothetical protein
MISDPRRSVVVLPAVFAVIVGWKLIAQVMGRPAAPTVMVRDEEEKVAEQDAPDEGLVVMDARG